MGAADGNMRLYANEMREHVKTQAFLSDLLTAQVGPDRPITDALDDGASSRVRSPVNPRPVPRRPRARATARSRSRKKKNTDATAQPRRAR